MFLIIRYVPLKGLAKAGICIAVFGVASYFLPKLLLYLTADTGNTMRAQYYTEPTSLFMLIGMIIGAIFLAIGILNGKKSQKVENI